LSSGDVRRGAGVPKPVAADGRRLDAVGREPPLNLLRGDFLLPVMLLKESALRRNLEAMSAYCAAHAVRSRRTGRRRWRRRWSSASFTPVRGE
jgi:hypothetical protein